MSVQTTADDARDKAREHVTEAIKELSKILIDECWGHDDYSQDYSDTLNGVFNQLREIKKNL